MTFFSKKDNSGNIYCFDAEGNFHRDDGGPAIEYTSGTKMWYTHGILHRKYGHPAVQSTVYNEWRVNGLYHREDGPAVEWADGKKLWYIKGKNIELFCNEHNVPYTYKDWTVEHKILWKLYNSNEYFPNTATIF